VPSLVRSFCVLTLLSGCASAPYPSIDDPMPPPELGVASTAARAKGAPKTPSAPMTLSRADVERVVDAGLGRFLGNVTIEPSLSGGKFTGWSIVTLEPPELWRGVDLRPGDVVTKVNGMAIEREMEAFDAFQAVRQAPALEVSFLRANQPRRLRFDIIGAPSPALPKAPPAPKAPAARNP
jgi:S1-C subfamily serine protease